MSNQQPEKTSRKKRTREEKKKLAMRILAMFLAILMVAGATYYAIYLMTLSVSSASVYAADVVQGTTIQDTSSLMDSGDVPVRVGLMMGESVTVSFEVTSTAGFIIGIAETTGDCTFTPIWELSETKVAVANDGNLSKRNMTYSMASSAYDAVIGGYHVQIDCDKYTKDEYTTLLSAVKQALSGYGLAVIPAYVYSGYTIRVGAFTTRSEAEQWADTVGKLYPNETVYATGASATSVSVLDPQTDAILFEYDCGGETELGLQGKQDANGNRWLKTPAANVYDGTFVFSRYQSGSRNGVALTNILPLEAYVAGVLPYEISNTWPLETLKAFAIVVRSYTLTHAERHTGTDVDMCNNAHCQVYKGAGRINRNVMTAVKETAGQVMTYGGEIVDAYYSSSMGGTTVSAKDAWGGDIPYLQAKETPWEDYMNHENAFWIVEMTPAELTERLRKAGHNIRGTVTNVEIAAYAENSTYVKVLKVTDSSGSVTQITGTDNVRMSLTPNVKSANFVVGKGKVEYTEQVIEITTVPATTTRSTKAETTEPTVAEPTPAETYVSTTKAAYDYDKDYGYTTLYGYHVLTAAEECVSDIDFSVTLLSAEGEQVYERSDIFVLSSECASAFTGEEVVVKKEEPKVEEVHVTETLSTSTETILHKVAYAENTNNFIFVGKGWGHGVGISQYGAYDLANLGYAYRNILESYFDGISLVDYRTTEGYRR